MKKVSWTKIAIASGVMGSAAGGQSRKKVKDMLLEIEPGLSFPRGGMDLPMQVVMAAACANLAIKLGLAERAEEPDLSKRESHRRAVEIETAVQDRVREALQLALDDYNLIADKQKALIKAYRGIFTPQEYKFISGALHSDRYQNLDDVQRGRLDKAFGIMVDKKLELCGDSNDLESSTLPKTVSDLMARRK